MDRDSVLGPEHPSMHLLLLAQPVDYVDPASVEAVVCEVVVEGKLDDAPSVEKLDGLPSRLDVNPAMGSLAIYKVVVQPDSKRTRGPLKDLPQRVSRGIWGHRLDHLARVRLRRVHGVWGAVTPERLNLEYSCSSPEPNRVRDPAPPSRAEEDDLAKADRKRAVP